MRRKFRAGRALAVVALATSLGATTMAQVASASTNSIKKGGTVTMAVAGLYSTFDPAISNVALFTGVSSMEAIYGPGLAYVNSTTGAIEMGQATSIVSSKGGKVWTLTLHKGMKFSDGTPFNAAAVCDLVHRDADATTGSVFVAVASTISCKVLGGITVRFTLQTPNFYFPAIVSQDFAFVPSPTAVAAEGSTLFGAQPVGAGPFKLQSRILSVSETYVKNPYYKLFAPGQPYLDGLTMEASGTLSQIAAALQSGQAQVANPINVQYANAFRSAGMRSDMHSTAGGAFLALGDDHPPFNNVLARRAVYDVINRQGIADVWTPGNPVTTNLFPTTSPLYNKKYNWPAGNSATAQALFDQLAAAGTPVKFTILWPSTTAPQTASYIQQLFASYRNVSVSVNLEPQVQYGNDAHAGNFQMTAEGLYNTSLIPAFMQWFHTGGNLNFMHWTDPTADAAMDRLYSDKTAASQAKDWGIIENELITQVPVIWTQAGRIGISYNANEITGLHDIEFGNATLWGGVHRI